MRSCCFYKSHYFFYPNPSLPPHKISTSHRKNSSTYSSSSSSFKQLRVQCKERTGEGEDASSPYWVLGVHPGCSPSHLKAAFRAKVPNKPPPILVNYMALALLGLEVSNLVKQVLCKFGYVKQFHPDVNRDGKNSDAMIRRVIQAYEMLTNYNRSEIIESECLDPFDEPECEACDIFINEVLCVGKGCPYSCVTTAPHAFTYASSTGTARATSQGHGEDYQVQAAVGQCPRSCIHYVTPSQRIILEELLDSILETPYDTSAEADLLYSLLVKAKFENNRFRKPKRQPETSTQNVDWF